MITSSIKRAVCVVMALLMLLAVVAAAAPAFASSGGKWSKSNHGNGKYEMSGGTLTGYGWNGWASYSEKIPAGKGFVFSYDLEYENNSYTQYRMFSQDGTWLFGRIQFINGNLRFTNQMMYNNVWYDYASFEEAVDTDKITLSIEFNHARDLVSFSALSPSGNLIFRRELNASEYVYPKFFTQKIRIELGGEANGEGRYTFSNLKINSTGSLYGDIIGYSVVKEGGSAKYSVNAPVELASVSWKLIDENGTAVKESTDKELECGFANSGVYTLSATITDAESNSITIYKNINVKEEADSVSDLKSIPFRSVSFISYGTGELPWQSYVSEYINLYQVDDPTYTRQDITSVSEKAELFIVDYGTSHYKSTFGLEAFAKKYDAAIKAIRTANPNAVIVLMNIAAPAAFDETMTLEKLVEYNYVIEATALKYSCILSNVYSVTSLASWTRNNYELISGEVFTSIAQHCSCMSLSSMNNFRFPFEGRELPEFYESAFKSSVNSVKTAVNDKNADKLADALWNNALCVDRSVYYNLNKPMREKVAAEFFALAEGKDLSNHETFVKIFITACYKAVSENQNTDMLGDKTLNTLVAVGDSISAGVGATNAKRYAWVWLAHAMLDNAAAGDTTLINKAISGTKLTQTQAGWPAANTVVNKDIVANNPDILFIAYGFNDQSAGVSAEDYKVAYDKYLKEITDALPNTIIVCLSITYRNGDGASALTRAYNKNFMELAEKYGCIYADVYADLLPTQWFIIDGAHPTDIGFRVMASTVFASISANLNFGKSYEDPYEVETVNTTVTEGTSTDPEGNNGTKEKIEIDTTIIIILLVVIVVALAAVIVILLAKKKK